MWSNIVYNSSQKWRFDLRSLLDVSSTPIIEIELEIKILNLNFYDADQFLGLPVSIKLRVLLLEIQKLKTILKGNNTLYLYQLTSIFECIHHVIAKLQGDKYFDNTVH